MEFKTIKEIQEYHDANQLKDMRVSYISNVNAETILKIAILDLARINDGRICVLARTEEEAKQVAEMKIKRCSYLDDSLETIWTRIGPHICARFLEWHPFSDNSAANARRKLAAFDNDNDDMTELEMYQAMRCFSCVSERLWINLFVPFCQVVSELQNKAADVSGMGFLETRLYFTLTATDLSFSDMITRLRHMIQMAVVLDYLAYENVKH